MTTLFILYVASGLLLAGLSIPLILRKVPPNPLYGFRVRATLEDPSVWYPVNAYSARWLLATGLATIAIAVTLACIPGISLDTYALGCLFLVMTLLVVGLARSFQYLARLTRAAESSNTSMKP